MAGELYLVDVLTHLRLLDPEMKLQNPSLYSFVTKSKQNLLIKSDLEQSRQAQDDIQKNLFKICCAICSLQVN